jgi:VanZ family protein
MADPAPDHGSTMTPLATSVPLRAALRLGFFVVLAAVFWLALLPVPDMVTLVSWQDKVEHALMFALLALHGVAAWPRQPLRVAAGLLAYGLAMELAQSATSYRQGDLLDWLADAAGVAAALLVVRSRRRGLR